MHNIENLINTYRRCGGLETHPAMITVIASRANARRGNLLTTENGL
ncbi:MAG: hypothetical protein IJR44_06985 [Neisseriaceae bacterium]|nr:hypothetical protein [Neisseriaceae bacterium]